MKHLSRKEKEDQIIIYMMNAFRFFPLDHKPSIADMKEAIQWLDAECTQATVALPIHVDGEEASVVAPFDFSFDNGDGLRMSLIMPNHPRMGMRRKFTMTMETDPMPVEKKEGPETAEVEKTS